MHHPKPPPFSCTYSSNLPELLQQLGCTLVLSTFQAGKVIFLSAKNDEELTQLPRNFAKPMGIALDGSKLAVACLDEVVVLANSPELATHYPKKPNTYDNLYMPRASYFTGQIDIHDLDYGEHGQLFAVNTSFSCLIKIDDNFSFTPIWQPKFISRLAAEDRCHLNGMALQAGKPKYATAFSESDLPQGWREALTNGGIVVDVEHGETIARNLPMPHSPRLFDDDLYLLLSATGELVKLDTNTGKYEVIVRLEGFVRGLCRLGDYVFVGRSRLRKNLTSFANLIDGQAGITAGVSVIHLPTGAVVGEIQYHTQVDEIYDVQAIPNCQRPGILNTERREYKLGLSTPEASYWIEPTVKEILTK